MEFLRYSAQREHGSDWKVVDNHHAHMSLASGLDQEEAETLADQWNSKLKKEKRNFVETP